MVCLFTAGFRRCPAGVLFLTAKKSSQKKADPHPRPCGLPCAAQSVGAAAELGPSGLRQSSPNAPRPPSAARRRWKGMETEWRFDGYSRNQPFRICPLANL